MDLRPRPLPGVLVANKMDLGERVQVLRQDGMQMAQVLQHGQSAPPPQAVPEVGSRTSSGRALQLWLVRCSQGRLAHRAPSHCLGCSS